MNAAMTTPAKAPDDPAAALSRLPASAARMAAVEILLSEPETLGDDVLESCLYLLRERLRDAARRPLPPQQPTEPQNDYPPPGQSRRPQPKRHQTHIHPFAG
jgi:hypothetical protein